MSEAIKPTPGPWVTKQNGFCECAVIAGDVWITYSSGNERTPIQERSANAALIAEAGTIHHETGLTPRQLVDRMKAVESAMRDAREMIEADHVDAAYHMLGEAITNLVKGVTP